MAYTKIVLKRNTRIYISDLKDIVQEAMNIHKPTPFSAKVLATAISVFAPYGQMKKEGEASINYHSKGGIKSILVDTSSNGDVRALVGNNNIYTEYDKDIEKVNSIPVAIATSQQGYLNIVNFYKGKSFGGKVKIIKGDIVTDFIHYLNQSEQIYSAVNYCVELKDKDTIRKAQSVIFQLLPDHDEKDIKWVEDFVKNNKMDKFDSAEEFEKAIDGQFIEKKELRWKCKCSKEKMEQVLTTLTPAEKETIIKEQGKIEIICQFCRKKYEFYS